MLNDKGITCKWPSFFEYSIIAILSYRPGLKQAVYLCEHFAQMYMYSRQIMC